MSSCGQFEQHREERQEANEQKLLDVRIDGVCPIPLGRHPRAKNHYCPFTIPEGRERSVVADLHMDLLAFEQMIKRAAPTEFKAIHRKDLPSEDGPVPVKSIGLIFMGNHYRPGRYIDLSGWMLSIDCDTSRNAYRETLYLHGERLSVNDRRPGFDVAMGGVATDEMYETALWESMLHFFVPAKIAAPVILADLDDYLIPDLAKMVLAYLTTKKVNKDADDLICVRSQSEPEHAHPEPEEGDERACKRLKS